jgi:hypothetical protein
VLKRKDQGHFTNLDETAILQKNSTRPVNPFSAGELQSDTRRRRVCAHGVHVQNGEIR